MIRIAVCDDNVPVADQIRQIWEAEAGKFWKDTQTEVFYDAESLIKADQEKVFDIYILDICMPGMDGFQAAERIRNRGGGRYLIFITSQDELVYQVFPYEPFAFIRKRTQDLVRLDMAEIMGRLAARFVQEEVIVLEGAYHIQEQVRIGEIRYLWSQKNYLLYMLVNNRQIRIRKAMERAQSELEKKGFLRIHRSLLVNMRYIGQIDYKKNCVEMTDGIKVTADLAGIQDYDVCQLLGNLLDNAIEASVQCEKEQRRADLKLYGDRHKCLIEVSNTTAGNVLENGRLPATAKKDSQNHGFGQISVADIVERYNGSMKFSEKEGQLYISVILFRRF